MISALFVYLRIIKHVTINTIIFKGYLNFAGAKNLTKRDYSKNPYA